MTLNKTTHGAERLKENASNLSLGGQQRLPKETVVAKLRSEEMGGMCEVGGCGEATEETISQRSETTQ